MYFVRVRPQFGPADLVDDKNYVFNMIAFS